MQNTANEAGLLPVPGRTARAPLAAERLRQAEVERLRLEERLDAQEEQFNEWHTARRVEIAQLAAQLARTQADRDSQAEDARDARALAAQLHQELATARLRVASLQQDAARYRGAAIGAEQRAEATRNTLSFRLGRALLRAREWRGLRALPAALWQLRQEALARRSREPRALPVARTPWLHELEPTLLGQGLQPAEALARGRSESPAELAAALTRLARLVLRTDGAAACRLARQAQQLEPRPFRTKWLAFLLHDAGQIVEPWELLSALPADTPLQASEKHRRQYIQGQHALRLAPLAIPPRLSEPVFEPVPDRVFYVAASSLPYNVSGYTLRTQGLLASLAAQGWELLCATRPGYPQDRPDAQEADDAGDRLIDGIAYRAVPGPHRRRTPGDVYARESAQLLAQEARGFRPAIVQAASNHESALPALLAARMLGVPFIYEVRGLWEYTTSSKVQGWEATERFALERQQETLVACEADLVFTLTEALADELVQRGVDRARIRLAPNAVDPQSLQAAPRDPQLAAELGMAADDFVIGYVGSVIGYEGLDDLVSALAIVRRTVPQARLLVVGDGDALPALRTQAAASGVADRVVFTGKVPPASVARYYALMHAVTVPRKPFKVCELVSPIKPVEIMLLGVPLVVSDVGALREMVRAGETALVHAAGDPESLAACLVLLAQDPALRARLVAAGRADVLAHRTWQHVASGMGEALRMLQAAPLHPLPDSNHA